MSVDDIRKAFSKAGIVIENGDVIIVYANNDGWINQSIFEEAKDTFLKLLEESKKLVIKYVKDRFFKLIFIGASCKREIIFYAPLTRELSRAELQELLERSREREPCNEFLDAFAEVDVSDFDSAKEALTTFVEKKNEEMFGNITGLDAIARWKIVRESATKLSDYLGFEHETIEIDGNYSGSVTIYLPELIREPIIISGEIKSLLCTAIKSSTGLDIECNIKEGFLNLTIYA